MTYKNCIHCDVCTGHGEDTAICEVIADGNSAETCKDFKDKSHLIEAPCKAGDTIYRISKWGDDKVFAFAVVVVNIFEDETIFVDDSGNEFFETDIGKTVFLTVKDAKAAVRERTENDL